MKSGNVDLRAEYERFKTEAFCKDKECWVDFVASTMYNSGYRDMISQLAMSKGDLRKTDADVVIGEMINQGEGPKGGKSDWEELAKAMFKAGYPARGAEDGQK
jgi:hypothetical protein